MISRAAFKILTASKLTLLTSINSTQRFSVFKKKTQNGLFPSKNLKTQPTFQSQQQAILKKQQVVEQASTNTLRQQITKRFQSLPSLLALREQVFKFQPQLIPFYLAAITQHINSHNYQQHLGAFQYINEELNNYLQELAMAPVECLMMLSYREKCRTFEKKYSFMNNFGFQRKATIVCASLIHKRQLQLNQIIYTLESLLKLGSMSILLIMNCVKFIKEVFTQRRHSITLVHLITILNTNLLKRNEITLQNILYDQVLNHLLIHLPTLLRNEVIEMKVQVLAVLMVLDGKKYYKSNRLAKQLWIKKIIKEIIGRLGNGWARELLGLGGQQKENVQLNWKHVLQIVECINFVKQNRLEEQCFINQFDLFLTKAHESLLQASKDCLNDSRALQRLNDNPQKIEHFFRLLFNQASLTKWLQPTSLSIYEQLLEKLIIATESIVYPLVDVLNQVKHNKKDPITKQLYKIVLVLYAGARKSDLIVEALAGQIIEFEAARKGMKIINELADLVLNDDSSQEPVLSYILLAQFYAKKFNLTDFQPPASLLKLLDEYLQTPKSFINCFYTTIRNFRNPLLASNSLQSFSENSQVLSNYLQKVKVARNIEEEAFQILNLMLITYCNNEGKTQPLFDATLEQLLKDQVKKHQFLAECYPESFPNPGEYYKRVNLLTSPATFKRNFEIILKYLKEPKYSYFIWDLLIKNYVRLPAKVREDCFQILSTVFLEAYQRQNLRKIILLMVLTNHISSGIIIAPKAQLRQLFQKCINMLIEAQDVVQYHYHCYLQILINAIASDILSLDCLHKIKAHTLDKNPEIKNTTTLMLLIGATFAAAGKWQEDPYLSELIPGQIKYLKYLVKGKRYRILNQESLDKGDEAASEGSVMMTCKVIATYLRFKIKELIQIKDIVLQFLEENNDFSEWILVAYSFKPDRKSKDKTDEWKQFQGQLASILVKKLKVFKELGMLSRQHELALTKYLK